MSDLVIRHILEQAEACRQLGSPFTASVLTALVEALQRRPRWAAPILAWPRDPKSDALALRIAGALHRIAMEQELRRLAVSDLAAAYGKAQINADLIDEALDRNPALLAAYLQSPPQTNDPQRSAVLLGGFIVAAAQMRRPITLAEIGASAGLNQLWDSYAYDFGSWQWCRYEPAPLHLRAQWKGAPPPMAAIVVKSRAACDIAPIDPADAAQRLRLLSYIWADQPARQHRVETALNLAAERKVVVEKIAAGDFVARELAQRPQDTAFLLYHSIVWQYMPAEERDLIADAMAITGASATKTAPLAWLRFEPGIAADGAELTLTIWPGGETRLLAIGDYHGRWVRWLV